MVWIKLGFKLLYDDDGIVVVRSITVIIIVLYTIHYYTLLYATKHYWSHAWGEPNKNVVLLSEVLCAFTCYYAIVYNKIHYSPRFFVILHSIMLLVAYSSM